MKPEPVWSPIPEPRLIVLIVIVVLLLAAGAFAWLTYNRLVALRLACENSWSQIDVALKLRHDLIPTLVAAVAGYAGHEAQTLTQVTDLRSDAVASDTSGPAQRGTTEARRPPNRKASIGTPAGSSHSGAIVGAWAAGTAKRALG